MRFSSFVSVAALAAVVAAAPNALPRGGTSCSNGDTFCCNSTQQSNPTTLSALSGLLGIVLPQVEGLIGITCTPLSILGVGGNSCTQQAVCCTNNNFNGLVNLGCNPINVNL